MTPERTFLAGLVVGWLFNSILAAVFGPWTWLGTLAWGVTLIGVFMGLRWWLEPRP